MDNSTMAKQIGITGNIGAGKTTVCRELERLGVPVYYADQRAKTLMATDAALRTAITAEFGPEAYTPEGLNRTYIGELVFTHPERLTALNALVHPAVAQDAARWHAEQRADYTLHEAAILLEIGAQDRYDAVVVVHCPEPIRRRRVMQRDGSTAEAFAQRAAQQWPDERKVAAADYVIVNDGSRLLLPQLLRLDRQLRT